MRVYSELLLIQFLVYSIDFVVVDYFWIVIVIQCFFCILRESICCSIANIQDGFGWFAIVRFNVERCEHVGKQTGIECQQKTNWFWEITRRLKLDLCCVHEHDKELDLEWDGIENYCKRIIWRWIECM